MKNQKRGKNQPNYYFRYLGGGDQGRPLGRGGETSREIGQRDKWCPKQGRRKKGEKREEWQLQTRYKVR